MSNAGTWNQSRATARLLRLAADHIEDGTFAQEGWALVARALDGEPLTEHAFRQVIAEQLEWDAAMIDEGVRTLAAWRRCNVCRGSGEMEPLRAVTGG